MPALLGATVLVVAPRTGARGALSPLTPGIATDAPPVSRSAFELHRPHLQRVAYAILGSLSEGEDVVQDAWLRLQRQADAEQIRDLRVGLTTTVSRLALDALSNARVRREGTSDHGCPNPWSPGQTPSADPLRRLPPRTRPIASRSKSRSRWPC